MPRKGFTEEQFGVAPRQADAGTPVGDIYRKLGIREIRRLKQLEEENRRLKQVVADLTLGKARLQDVVRPKWRRPPAAARW